MIPLTLKQGIGPHLQMRWETRGPCQLVAVTRLSSRVVTVIPGPLPLHEGSPASSQVLRGNSGLLSRRYRRKETHLTWTGESYGFSRLCRVSWDSSPSTTGNSGILSCCVRKIKSPFELQGQALKSSGVTEGDQASFRMEGGISICFSSCGQKCGFPHVATGT